MVNRFLIFISLLALAACEGSAAYYADLPNRRSVDGIAVVYDQGAWHAWHEGIVVNTGNPIEAKQRQIAAIESASGCQVIDTAFSTGVPLANFMSAQVQC